MAVRLQMLSLILFLLSLLFFVFPSVAFAALGFAFGVFVDVGTFFRFMFSSVSFPCVLLPSIPVVTSIIVIIRGIAIARPVDFSDMISFFSDDE